ncbi:hypothetical protein Cgig2_002315 [Carnegiea gigantea]|uniref:1-phosphatidylinositol-4-phosphate 5-kinase n=1 Tax=Carnegiea gigantea TaxID=171969 RepID=A0A9Q1JZ91_9CARY|nr:hypothetical protein Cgig2_002315 [Carnegiea gigantea]
MALLRKQLSSSSLKSSRTTNIQYSKQRSLPPGTITEFVWKDYSSTIFRNIQELGNVKYEDYMITVSRHETLMELALQGGCGRPFFLPHDDRFVIKTLRKSEAKLLIEILPSYYDHIKTHANCLLAKYYGLHATRPGIGGSKVYFVVMENLLQTDLHIHKQYDLKGSAQGRSPGKSVPLPRTTLKDTDFDLCFLLHQSTRNQLLEQIKLDCKFLEEHGIMGYSLLLGIHLESLQQVSPTSGAATDKKAFQESTNEDSVKKPPVDDSKQAKSLEVHHHRDPTLADFVSPPNRQVTRFAAKLPARAIKVPHHSNLESMSASSGKEEGIPEGSSVYLYLGIIDFIKNYNVIKRIEHAYKSLQYNAKDIPSVKPQLYATRFQEFLRQVFLVEGFPPRSQGLFDLNRAFS